MRLQISGRTDIGRRKKQNEDQFGIFDDKTPNLEMFKEGALLCIADGLGGHIGGHIASKLAVSIFADMLTESLPETEVQESAGADGKPAETDGKSAETDPEKPAHDARIPTVLREWMARANGEIFETNSGMPLGAKAMGTTFCAALVQPGQTYVLNVGDSRCYHIRNNAVAACTKDHSWVDEQVEAGLMSRQEAEVDKRRHLITRCVGTHESVEPDTYVWPTKPGDLILLCTDGLCNMLTDEEMLEEIRRGGTLADLTQRLVDRANAQGGRDNITVIVAQVEPSWSMMAHQKLTTFSRRHGRTVIKSALVLLFGAACFAAGYLARGFFGS